MAFTIEQAEEIKKKLLEQVENLPNENKEQIKEYITGLNEIELEEFLKQNNVKLSENNQVGGQQKSVFELIVNNEIPSYKISENKEAVATLELNPLSKGHCLVIPKQKTGIEKINKEVFSLAQKLSKKIKTKLNPDDMKIETFSFQNYPAINVIPVYNERPLKKEKADEEELKKLQLMLSFEKKEKVRTLKPKITKSKNLPEIGFRIP